MKTKIEKYRVLNVFNVKTLNETIDWGLLKQNVPSTWDTTQGEGINIFILDTGGNSNHSDLKPNLLGGINFSTSKTLHDLNGHSTHCAGIIAASKNSRGVIGVAPKAKIFLVKVLDDTGNGTFQSLEAGLKYCYDLAISNKSAIKPHIISMSLGSTNQMPSIHTWIKKLYDLNIPVVCAAGNEGRDGILYPAKYDETIAIGAFDINENLGNFSSVGPEIDFAAPGVNVYSTWKNNQYAVLSGTSMAAPFMAGVIALLLSKHKLQEAQGIPNNCKTVPQIVEHLVRHSIDKGTAGKDANWGWGIIDIEKLLLQDETIGISIEFLVEQFMRRLDKKYRYSSSAERNSILADLRKIIESSKTGS